MMIVFLYFTKFVERLRVAGVQDPAQDHSPPGGVHAHSPRHSRPRRRSDNVPSSFFYICALVEVMVDTV